MRVFWILTICWLGWASAFAQNTRLTSSTASMGYAASRNANTEVRSVVGQAFNSPTQGVENNLESGFLGSDFLVNSGLLFLPEDTVTQLTSPDVVLNLPEGFVPTAQFLFFRQGGELGYRLGSLVREGNGYRLSIPEAFITERGLEYYLLFRADDVVVTFPARNPVQQPAVTRVEVPRLPSPQQLEERRYRMISLPLEISGQQVMDQLSDDYGQYNVSQWRLFRYIDGAYVEGPALPATFSPGEAFWLITEQGRSFSVSGGISTNTAQSFELNLQPGWNQIGNPFAFPVAWDAASDSLLENPIYFNGSDFETGITILQPWEGYWVFNRGETTQIKRIRPREVVSELNKILADEPDEGAYQLQLQASSGSNARDNFNFLGFKSNAEDGEDPFDFRDPPPAWQGLRLSIEGDGQLYAGNFKSLQGNGKDWDLTVNAPSGGGTVQIALAETGQLQPNFSCYIFDLDKEYLIPVRENRFTLHLAQEEKVRRLRLVLGTESYAVSVSNGISMVPLDYQLAQNYPNPFNPETTINFEIREMGRVQLDVYNILGQRVRSLLSGTQDAGRYKMKWDGLNDHGQRVASGVYLYRLQAGKWHKTRKMVLIK